MGSWHFLWAAGISCGRKDLRNDHFCERWNEICNLARDTTTHGRGKVTGRPFNPSTREVVMRSLILSAVLAVATLATFLGSTSEAQAQRWGRGGGRGWGVSVGPVGVYSGSGY